MRKIRPLTGQVLIEVLPTDNKTPGGIDLPEVVRVSPDVVQEQSHDPQKPVPPNIGIVRAIGPWPKLPNGMTLLPEFGVGARVAFNPYRGDQLRYETKPLRLVRLDDVLAVLS